MEKITISKPYKDIIKINNDEYFLVGESSYNIVNEDIIVNSPIYFSTKEYLDWIIEHINTISGIPSSFTEWYGVQDNFNPRLSPYIFHSEEDKINDILKPHLYLSEISKSIEKNKRPFRGTSKDYYPNLDIFHKNLTSKYPEYFI
jgi:hypothetical protein